MHQIRARVPKTFGTIGATLIATALFVIFDANQTRASMLFNVNVQVGSDPLDTQVLVEEVGADLKFTLTVDDSNTGNIGDLRAIYFDVADESLLSGLNASGPFVTDQDYDANSVSNLGGGSVINPLGPFDAGVEIGTSGMGGDDLQTTMFTLSHSTLNLDLNTFFRTSTGTTDYIMAIRGTSVGPASSGRSGSSKTAVTGPTPANATVPEPATIAMWSVFAVGLIGYTRRRRLSA